MLQTFKRYLSAEGLRLGNTYSDRGGKDGYSRKKKRIYILDKVKRETKMEGYKIHIHMQCESKTRWWVVGLSPTSTRQCMGCICWEYFIRHEAHPLINLVEKTKDDRAGTRPIYTHQYPVHEV